MNRRSDDEQWQLEGSLCWVDSDGIQSTNIIMYLDIIHNSPLSALVIRGKFCHSAYNRAD